MPVSEDFAKAMVYLAEAYGVSLSEQRIVIYADALSDLSMDQVKTAMRRAVRECKFFPAVSDLRALVIGAPSDEGMIQWTGLCRAAERFGAYQHLIVHDHATSEALKCVFGNWGSFCEQCVEGPALAIKRQEFLAAYRFYKAIDRGPAMNKPCVMNGLLTNQSPPVAALALDGRAYDVVKVLTDGRDVSEG